MNIQGNQEFVERFDYVCEKYADKAAITYLRDDGTKDDFTFKEIHGRVKNAKERFKNAGLCPGDRAAIISPHTPFAVMAGYALAYANIAAVLIDSALPMEEINRLLEFSDVRAVFTVPAAYENIDKSKCGDIPVFDLSNEASEYHIFPGSAETATRPATADPDLDVISILFSSGTTSTMKGIMLNFYAVENSRPMFYKLTNTTDNISLLFALPFNHVAGFFIAFQIFLSGNSLGMIEKMDALKIAAAFHSYQPEFFALVPKFYEIVEQKIRQSIKEKGRIIEGIIYLLLVISHFSYKYLGLNIGKYLFKSIRARVFGKRLFGLGSGGAMCNESTVSFFLDLGIGIWANFYSLTETYVPTIATGTFERYPAGTEGKINRFDGIDVKIHDPDENGVGEIRIKTILIMKGYFRDPEQTAAAFDEDGYFKTGDLGYIDKKDYLHVTGRMKEAIHMHTGKKVAPTDVDSFYSNHFPDIAIASSGVPSKDGTYDEIHLFIEKGELSADGQQELRKKIIDISSQSSTLYQISSIHFIDKLPLTSVGKVKRFQLRETVVGKQEKK